MAQSYRILQQWHEWLINDYSLANSIIETEQKLLRKLIKKHLGKHVVMIGVQAQHALFATTHIPIRTLLSPLSAIQSVTDFQYIESDLHELPILTGSIDLVLIPHTLQFADRARQLLAEACRIVKPEGLLVIIGLNPYSFWGLNKLLRNNKNQPWAGQLIGANQIRNWLQLAEFYIENHVTCLFRPPARTRIYHQLQFLERLGNACFPKLGGAYLIVARAKVIPLTPIRMRWKQQLSGIRITTSVSGHIV